MGHHCFTQSVIRQGKSLIIQKKSDLKQPGDASEINGTLGHYKWDTCFV